MQLRDWGSLGLTVAISINMMAIGLWHGARWSYLAFGAINSVYMVVSALTLKRRNQLFKNRPRLARLRSLLGPVITFHMVVVAFVFFRARDLSTALTLLRRFVPPALGELPHSVGAARAWLHVQLHGLNTPYVRVGIAALPVMALVHAISARGWTRRLLLDRPLWLRWAVYYVATVGVIVLAGTTEQQFIYARF
jgi:hypothetical protein